MDTTSETSLNEAVAPKASTSTAANVEAGAPGSEQASGAAEAQPNGAGKAPPKNGIVVTPAAVEYAKNKLEKRGTPGAAIRLGVKGGSCAGYSYVIQFEDKDPKPRDYVYEYDGVRFIVDKKSFVFLAGSMLDYEQTLMFQGFKFRNPQEAKSCGCGHSFSVK